MPKSEGPGDLGAQAKAQAIAEVVKSRETTNQQMIHLLRDIFFYITCEQLDYFQLSSLDFIRLLFFYKKDHLSVALRKGMCV